MKWYNNTGEIEPIQPKGIVVPTNSNSPSIVKSNQALPPTPKTSNIDKDSLTEILGTVLNVSQVVKAQRQKSGAAAQRQARIEACGRKGLGYLFSRRKKEEYRKCVEAANSATYNEGAEKSTPPPPPAKSNTMLFVGVGIGAVLIIGTVAYFVMRKK